VVLTSASLSLASSSLTVPSSTPAVVALTSTSSDVSSPTTTAAATTSLPPYSVLGAAGRQQENIALAVLVGGLCVVAAGFV